MPRHSKPADLALQNGNGLQNGVQPGPNSSPMNLQGVDLGSFGGGFEHDVAAGLTPLPAQPQSPPGSPRSAAHNRDPSKNFLSNFKSRISPEQEQRQKKDSRQGSHDDEEYRPGTSSMSKIYHLRKNPGSTPELSLVGSQDNVHKDTSDGEKPPLPGPRPQPTPHHSEDSTASARRKDNSKPFRIGITRSKSIRRDSESKTRPKMNGKDSFEQQAPPNTAPLQSDWPGSEARMSGKEKEKRGKSAERAPASESQENLARPGKDNKQNAFKTGSRNVVEKARSGGTSFFNRLGKIGRSSSSNERERGVVHIENYEPTVITLPLDDQTRITRISKQLSQCRDKTEYWMPALPWRCIDYLNSHCEDQGMYRIPGSTTNVKNWQRRFDTEYDIDLLSEDISDPNEIASMLKSWLRAYQNDPIIPKELQAELAREMEQINPDYQKIGEPAPQLLRDALSDLPPFNYYLLFAITCHLSLLLTNKDKNLMDLNNLAVCVMPCLYMDRWLFNYLVGDWRHCWQGCYTEKEYLKVEEDIAAGRIKPAVKPAVKPEAKTEQPSDSENGDKQSTIDDGKSEAVSVDDRAISSGTGSTASKPTTGSRDNTEYYQGENTHPMNYMTPGAKAYSNGTVGLGINEEPKRPRTADQRHAPEEGMKGGQTKSRSNSTTPKVGHNRSRSDLPATPVNTHANTEWPQPVRPS